MKFKIQNYISLILLISGILIIFVGYVLPAGNDHQPNLFDYFDTISILGSVVLILKYHKNLDRSDWLIGISIAIIIGVGMNFKTLFSPYPFFGIINSDLGLALIRSLYTFLAILGGIIIMRQGGPVQFRIANHKWKKSGISILIGLLIGLPLAVLNVFALRITQGHPIVWQSPLAALLDALQPAIVEEMIYRFAFLGLVWKALQGILPKQAIWLSGLLTLLVHNYAHLGDLFRENPLLALGMGAVMLVVWGLPETILAFRRDIESATSFHYIQDFARFITGF
jgi:hypothetical protein